MSCQYKDECPSCSGWCEGPKQDFSKCVQFLITAVENERTRPKVSYLCDHRACERCSNIYCNHTDDIRHAKNFQNFGGTFIECERDCGMKHGGCKTD